MIERFRKALLILWVCQEVPSVSVFFSGNPFGDDGVSGHKAEGRHNEDYI